MDACRKQKSGMLPSLSCSYPSMTFNVWEKLKRRRDGRLELVQMMISDLIPFQFVPIQKFNSCTGDDLLFSKHQRLCRGRLIRATATWEQQPRKPRQATWATGSIWMIRMDLVNLFQETTLGIILVFRRLNQQFDELGALLYCSTGLKGKLLFCIIDVESSKKASVGLWEEGFAGRAGDEQRTEQIG